MVKKQSASSQPGKLVSVSADDIAKRPRTRKDRAALARIAAQQAADDDSSIDFSDLPELTEQQLAKFHRPTKELVAVRLDADVAKWLRDFGPGYSTRINSILRKVMERAGA